MATPSLNELTNGPIADMYASNYGIPTDIFRNVIRSSSDFNPNFNGPNGSGIANLNVSPSLNVNTSDTGQSLDFAARYLSSIYKATGDWTKAANEFLNIPDTSMQYDAMGNPTGVTADTVPKSDTSKTAGKYIWQYSMQDVKDFLTNSAYGFMIGLAGVILIVGSLWFLLKKSEE